MESAPNPLNFIRSFWPNWWALISGAPSIPFTFWALVEAPEKQKGIFLVLAVICLALAAYFIWSEERKKVCKLEDRLSPKINLEFGEDVIGCKYYLKDQDLLCIRIKVTTKAGRLNGCLGSLLRIDKLENGRWERQEVYAGSQTLRWFMHGPKIGVPITKNFEAFLEVLEIKVDNSIGIMSHTQPIMRIDQMLNSGGVFRFHISVVADDTEEEFICVSFQAGNERENCIISRLSCD